MIMENWKKQLKQMKLEYLEKTAPDFFKMSGGYQMKVKRYTDATANALTSAIQDFIKFSGGYSNRISTVGTMRRINGEMKWTKGNTNKGAADIRALYKSVSIDIEVKVRKDKLSEAQIKEAARIESAGGHYIVAKDFTSFLEYWNEIFQSEKIEFKSVSD
jgi:hypothetical protein